MDIAAFRQPEFEAMKRVEQEVVRVLLPFRETTECGLMVFALVRCARVLIRRYPPATQRQLLDAVVPFLEGKTAPRGGLETESGIFIPE